MNASRAWQKLHELEASPELHELRARDLPFREVALAVVDLRGRLGITQQQLAERAGTTQSVVSRLESGRHPVEVTLLARIAEACGEPLRIEFGRSSEAAQDVAGEPTTARR